MIKSELSLEERSKGALAPPGILGFRKEVRKRNYLYQTPQIWKLNDNSVDISSTCGCNVRVRRAKYFFGGWNSQLFLSWKYDCEQSIRKYSLQNAYDVVQLTKIAKVH